MTRIYLEHILESFSKVGHYLRNVDYETFLADEEKQDAIIRIRYERECVGVVPGLVWRIYRGCTDKPQRAFLGR